ncbi:hypothetical protein FRB99_004589 [Tulasnella sp. 403]|nr:hypothetical protein FRB99_004589 [Tulasnella sp. 403]
MRLFVLLFLAIASIYALPVLRPDGGSSLILDSELSTPVGSQEKASAGPALIRRNPVTFITFTQAIRSVFAGNNAVRWDKDALLTLIKGSRLDPSQYPELQRQCQQALDLWLERVAIAPSINPKDAELSNFFKSAYNRLSSNKFFKFGGYPRTGAVIGQPPVDRHP